MRAYLGSWVQLPDGGERKRIKPGTATRDVLQNTAAHARIPEILDVLRDLRHRARLALSLEELGDLVRHHDELVMLLHV